MSLLARAVAPYREGLRGLDRRVWLVVTMTLVSVGARMSLYTFLGIYFTREVGIPLALVGAAYLVENLVRGLVSPLAGALSDRVGRKPVLVGAALAGAGAIPGLLHVDGALALFLWGALVGACQAGLWPATSALLLDLTPPARRQAVLGLNYTAISVGYTLGVAPAGFLLALGFPALAAASAAGFLLIAVTYLLALRAPRPVETGPPRSFLRDLAVAPRDPAFLLLAALGVVFPLGIGLLANVAPLYAADAGLDEGRIGLALAVNGPLLAVLSIPVAAWLAGRGPYRYLAVSAALLALSYVALVWSAGFGALVAASVVFTLGELVFSSALPTAVGGLAPPALRGAYQGSWAFVFSLGVGGAVFFAGLMESSWGWRNTWIAWTAITALVSLGSRWRGRRSGGSRTRGRRPNSRPLSPRSPRERGA